MSAFAQFKRVWFAVSFLTLTGCHVFEQKATEAPESSNVSTRGQFRVTEGALQGQRIDIPQAGMSLDEAIARTLRPGALNLVFVSASDELINPALRKWVSIRRGNSRFFIPLFLVQNTMVGSIQISNHDVLDLVDQDIVGSLLNADGQNDPRLSAVREAGQSYVVSGLHSHPGVFKTTTSGFAARSIRGTALLNNVEATVAVLNRSTGPITDQYLLPVDSLRDFGVDTQYLNAAKIREGDQIHFTRFELLNLVRSGIRRARVGRDEENRRMAIATSPNPSGIHNRLHAASGLSDKLHAQCPLPPLNVPRL